MTYLHLSAQVVPLVQLDNPTYRGNFFSEIVLSAFSLSRKEDFVTNTTVTETKQPKELQQQGKAEENPVKATEQH
jgi:hypothetical protein